MAINEKHMLNVVPRTANGSNEASRVRAQGKIPAVIYSKTVKPVSIAVNAAEWEALQKYEFKLVTLKSAEGDHVALVKEVQHNFIKGKASHIDFLAVDMNKPITTKVPLHKGHADPAGLSQGGILEQYVHEVEVEALPANLPEFIVADISGMNIDDSFHVSDLVLPEGVTAKTHGEITLFHIVNPLSIKEEEAPAAAAAAADSAAPAQPEVVGEKERAERAAAREEEKKK